MHKFDNSLGCQWSCKFLKSKIRLHIIREIDYELQFFGICVPFCSVVMQTNQNREYTLILRLNFLLWIQLCSWIQFLEGLISAVYLKLYRYILTLLNFINLKVIRSLWSYWFFNTLREEDIFSNTDLILQFLMDRYKLLIKWLLIRFIL